MGIPRSRCPHMTWESFAGMWPILAPPPEIACHETRALPVPLLEIREFFKKALLSGFLVLTFLMIRGMISLKLSGGSSRVRSMPGQLANVRVLGLGRAERGKGCGLDGGKMVGVD